MNTPIFLKNGLDRVHDYLGVWWSDIRFRWSLWNKTPLLFVSGIMLGVTVFTLLISTYFNNRAERRQISCLAMNIYHEARGEPEAGQYAVAEVTMNRVASKHYPNSICEVVYQQNWDDARGRYVGMFSWTELNRKPGINNKLWIKALDIAQAVYRHDYTPAVRGALFYHAKNIRPKWVRGKRAKARIGNHIFY